MSKALELAQSAALAGEVPVACLLVAENGQLLASAANQTIAAHDATAHAEVMVLRQAGQSLGNHRLVNTTLYVTIEPCMMCAGALVQARIARLVYGAREPKAGAVDSHPSLNQPWLNHRIAVQGGVLEQECGQLMSEFFHHRRQQIGDHRTIGDSPR